jgi:hypothetical protein
VRDGAVLSGILAANVSVGSKLRPEPPAWHVRSAAGIGHVHDRLLCARSELSGQVNL